MGSIIIEYVYFINIHFKQSAFIYIDVYNEKSLIIYIFISMLQILQKQLDESTFCPLCQASMYYVEAEEFEKEVSFHQCSHCNHQVFQNNQRNCHCETCQSKRRKLIKETRLQETRKLKKKIILN